MKKFCFALMIIFVSCSVHDSRRNFAEGEITFSGGMYQNSSWKENMTFKRYSWYSEATMVYDLLLHKLDKTSKFAEWLDRDKSLIENCNHIYIALIYSARNTDLKPIYFAGEFEKVGYERHTLTDFSDNLFAHHAYRDWRLFSHKLFGFCKKDLNTNPIKIRVPGFSPKILK